MSRFYIWDEENQRLIPLGIFHMIHDFSLVKIEEDLQEEYILPTVIIPNIYNKLAIMSDDVEDVIPTLHEYEFEENFEVPVVAVPSIYNQLSVMNETLTVELADPL